MLLKFLVFIFLMTTFISVIVASVIKQIDKNRRQDDNSRNND